MILETKYGRFVPVGGKVPESVFQILEKHKVNKSAIIQRALKEEAERLEAQ